MSTSTVFRLALLSAAMLAMATGTQAEPSAQATPLQTYTQADGTQCFALNLTPVVPAAPAAAHDVVVLLDTSAAQTGRFRDESYAAVRELLQKLGPQDRVHLMAIDIYAVPMTEHFVAAQGPEMAAALTKLDAREPLGATDLWNGLDTALKSFEKTSHNPRTIVYIGDGRSPANFFQHDKFKQLVGTLVENRVSVNSLAVGLQCDPQTMASLAGRTGGLVVTQAQQPGAALAAAVQATVYWPTNVQWPASVAEVFPKPTAPLRSDRDTTVVGTLRGEGPVTVQMTAETAGGPQTLEWNVAVPPSSSTNAYLSKLVDAARKDGGLTLPLTGSASLAWIREAITSGSQDFIELAGQAVHANDLEGAKRLAQEAQRQDPANPEAQALLKLVAEREQQPATEAPAAETAAAPATPAVSKPAAPGDLNLVGPATANPPVPATANPPVPAPLESDGALLGTVERERQIISQSIITNVQTTINQARGIMGTEPDVATQRLKLQMEQVRQAPELSTDVRSKLTGQLQAALRETAQRSEETSLRRQQAQEGLATVKEQVLRDSALAKKQQKLEQLMERFNKLMDEGRFVVAEKDVAEEAVKQATTYSPADPAAVTALQNARLVGRYYEQMHLRSLRQQLVWETLEQAERSHVPFPDEPPVLYPPAEVWNELSVRRKDKYSQVDLAKRGPNEKKIMEELERLTTVDFNEQPLNDVVNYLKDLHGIEIQLDQKALEEQAIAPDLPITRSLAKISLRSALRLILRDHGLTYMIKDEVLLITTPEQAAENLVTKVYPVGDLVIPVTSGGGGMGGGMGMGGMMGGMGGGMMGGMGGGMGGMGGGMGGMMGGMGGGMFNLPFPMQNLLNGNGQGNANGGLNNGGLNNGGLNNGFQAFAVSDDLNLAPAAAAKPAPAASPAAPSAEAPAIVLEIAAGSDPAVAWNDYFAKNEPTPKQVRETVRRLMQAKSYDQVIALIRGALRQHQAQPWMYEALGLAMQAAGRPVEDVERALLSTIDFAQNSVDLLYAALYLEHCGLDKAALRIYRNVAQVEPLRPEPYVQGLKVAQRLDDLEATQWAAVGILSQAWSAQQEEIWKNAYRVATVTLERLKNEQRTAEAEQFEKTVTQALARDCVVIVRWTGEADLDLMIEEPAGTVCSYRSPRTTSGGILIGDNTSRTQQANAEAYTEAYVCPKGFSGAYRVSVRRVWGSVTDNKVSVEVIAHWRTPEEKSLRKILPLDKDGVTVKFDLVDGRRSEPLQETQVANAAVAQLAVRQQVLAQQLAASADPGSLVGYARSRQGGGGDGLRFIPGNGAVGYQPVIVPLPEGGGISPQAVVSADRRYVRITPNPWFAQIGAVHTFNYMTGATGTSSGGTGGGGYSGGGGSSSGMSGGMGGGY